MQAEQFGAGVARAGCGGDAIALAAQEARQQVADAAVVVDQQKMRRVVGRLRRRTRDSGSDWHGHSFAFVVRFGALKIFSSTLSGSSRSIMARRKRRTVSALAGPMSASARSILLVCRPA